jgi:membrane protein implicated in regulation of membrane protease activity
MRWPRTETQIPDHPFRDSAILYAILAAIIVGGSALTGGGLGRGVVIAVVFFVFSTAWTWWRFRQRLQARGRR